MLFRSSRPLGKVVLLLPPCPPNPPPRSAPPLPPPRFAIAWTLGAGEEVSFQVNPSRLVLSRNEKTRRGESIDIARSRPIWSACVGFGLSCMLGRPRPNRLGSVPSKLKKTRLDLTGENHRQRSHGRVGDGIFLPGTPLAPDQCPARCVIFIGQCSHCRRHHRQPNIQKINRTRCRASEIGRAHV